MFRLMRNTHLALGVAFFFVALLFALSSIVFIYRPWFPAAVERTTATLPLQPGGDARSAALELMRSHGFQGELRNVMATPEAIQFMIWRPGTHIHVVYHPGQGTANVESRRYNLYETLLQLHVNHGFWHDFPPANLWALLSLGVSVGLVLLGASGIYLWNKHPQERLIGTVLLVIGIVTPLGVLAYTRILGS